MDGWDGDGRFWWGPVWGLDMGGGPAEIRGTKVEGLGGCSCSGNDTEPCWAVGTGTLHQASAGVLRLGLSVTLCFYSQCRAAAHTVYTVPGFTAHSRVLLQVVRCR